jgi:hypothetical protein
LAYILDSGYCKEPIISPEPIVINVLGISMIGGASEQEILPIPQSLG